MMSVQSPDHSNHEAGERRPVKKFWERLRFVLISLLFVAGTTAILLFPILPSRRLYNLKLGDIVPEDIRATTQVSYVSQIETEAAREAAAASVGDVYDPPDPRIGRQQVRKARQIMDFIATVRADPYADEDLKISYLERITDLDLPPEMETDLLTITDSQFEQVSQEVVRLVEDAMSGEVKEGQEEQVRSQLELRVSTDLPEVLIPLTVSVAHDLVVANRTLNVEATERARQEAAEAVREVRYTFQPGEVVIRAGERVDEQALEALVALGLASERRTWRDAASALLISLLALATLVVYLVAFNPPWASRPGYLLIIVVLFLLFLLVGQIMLPGRQLIAYLFPAAALGLALNALVGVEFASLVAVLLALFAGFLADGSFEIAVFATLSSLLATGSLRRGGRLNAFFLAGIFAALGGMAVLLIFRLPNQPESFDLAQLLSAALINGLLSAGAALVILFVVGSVTSLTTSLQLLDLARPDHPLQRLLQQQALGTYHHTLSVANLVEAAADAIGADSLLARVGTLYHDVGKTANPGFFIENRTEGSEDPHRNLSPEESAAIIKAHVADGLKLARKYRLPPQVTAFISEHHGTMPILYFLNKAREEAAASGEEVDLSRFCYDGPIPQSRETAILMLADGCESAVRANRPTSEEEIEEIVTRIIQQRLDLHQLDDSGLTLTDIKVIKDAFVRTLRGMYHPRIKYPGDKKGAEALPPGLSDAAARLPAASATPTIPTPVEAEHAPDGTTDETRPGRRVKRP